MSREVLTLRQQALEALQKSTRMLEMAFDLRKHGNRAEADRVRNEARAQRTISTILMAESNNVANSETSPPDKQSQNALPTQSGH